MNCCANEGRCSADWPRWAPPPRGDHPVYDEGVHLQGDWSGLPSIAWVTGCVTGADPVLPLIERPNALA
jgi:hypothetical protein